MLPKDVRSQVEQLSLEQSEQLGDALLDFGTLAGLVNWLAQDDVNTRSLAQCQVATV